MASESTETLPFLPVALNIRGKDCLVVGGGAVGTRKVQTLLRAGGLVTVVAPNVSRELAQQIEAGHIRWVQESFQDDHLVGAFLVVAATDDQALNAAVVRQADRCGMLVCDASSAERSQVIFGALFNNGDTTVAVYTGGRDPAKARRTRDRIADLVTGTHKSEPRC